MYGIDFRNVRFPELLSILYSHSKDVDDTRILEVIEYESIHFLLLQILCEFFLLLEYHYKNIKGGVETSLASQLPGFMLSLDLCLCTYT